MVRSTTVQGAKISYQHWPNPGAPGLVLLHGHAAHARWWDFVAPAFTARYNVIAIDQSGSGESEHRDSYTMPVFAEELLACSVDAELEKPHLVGHSFGGTISRIACWLHPEAFSSLVMVDSVIPSSKGDRSPPSMPRTKTRYYPSAEQAMRRFRLRPPQPCANDFVVAHIARHSVKETEAGYMFKLDPAVFAKMPIESNYPVATDMIRELKLPVAMIYGESSRFFPPGSEAFLTRLFGEDYVTGISEAHHHVFLDQPLRFITALEDMLLKLQVADT